MFTGLIQDIGKIAAFDSNGEGARLRIETSLAPEIGLGDSIAVNGVCLTATATDDSSFETEAMNQTLRVTALGDVAQGGNVNLELAMKASERLGGHIVQGHVDGVGAVLAVEEDGFSRRLRIGLDPELLRYAIDKGSICLSGVSLTVSALADEWVEVSLIPETLERTALSELEAGSRVNVECDIVAKYVERLVAPFAGKDAT
jgi:riboflavin synthase